MERKRGKNVRARRFRGAAVKGGWDISVADQATFQREGCTTVAGAFFWL